MVNLLPTNRFTLTSPDPLPQVVARLATYIEPAKTKRWRFSGDHAPYEGTISETGFEISRIIVIHYRNSFLPVIRGQFEVVPTGTAVHIRQGLHPLVIVFLVIWYVSWYSTLIPLWLLGPLASETALLCLGLPLLILAIFWGAFWYEAHRIRQELTHILTGEQQAAAYFRQQQYQRGQGRVLQTGLVLMGIAITLWQFSRVSPWTPHPTDIVSAPPLCAQAPDPSPYCSFALQQTLTGQTTATALALSGDGQTLASGGQDKSLRVWNLKTGQLRASFQNDSGQISTVAITADGNTVVSGSGDRMVRIWRLASQQPPQLLKGHTDGVQQVAITTDGQTLISGSNEEVMLWDLATGQRRATLPDLSQSQIKLGPLTIDTGPRRFHLLALNPATQTAIWEFLGGDVVVWDLVADRQVMALRERFDDFSGYVLSAQVSPDGQLAALQYSNSSKKFETRLKVWDLTTGQVVARGSIAFNQFTFLPIPMALSSDAIVGTDGDQLKVWNLQTAHPAATLSVEWMDPIVLSRDGKLLAGISGDPAYQNTEIRVLRRP